MPRAKQHKKWKKKKKKKYHWWWGHVKELEWKIKKIRIFSQQKTIESSWVRVSATKNRADCCCMLHESKGSLYFHLRDLYRLLMMQLCWFFFSCWPLNQSRRIFTIAKIKQKRNERHKSRLQHVTQFSLPFILAFTSSFCSSCCALKGTTTKKKNCTRAKHAQQPDVHCG